MDFSANTQLNLLSQSRSWVKQTCYPPWSTGWAHLRLISIVPARVYLPAFCPWGGKEEDMNVPVMEKTTLESQWLINTAWGVTHTDPWLLFQSMSHCARGTVSSPVRCPMSPNGRQTWCRLCKLSQTLALTSFFLFPKKARKNFFLKKTEVLFACLPSASGVSQIYYQHFAFFSLLRAGSKTLLKDL